MLKYFFILLGLFAATTLSAQAHNDAHPVSLQYEYPAEKDVAQKLEQWRDLKFGVLIHWGIYAVPGIIESWSICNEEWINRDTNSNYCDYKEWYFGLSQSFNPTQFNPEQWAAASQQAGMKYVVFTTKHHDGFCMFDSKYTDYSIAKGPFKDHPKADVAKYVFDAYRKQNFMIGAYFSKPDWHTPFYWWPRYATPDRNVNYDIRKFPDRWQRYKDFTHNQIREITGNMGPVDILWLDGGWVRPANTVTEEVLSWGMPIPPFAQDIDMPKVSEIARKNQPGILIVDRTIHGKYENYKTPEQSIPAGQSDEPWESCITLGGSWGHTPNDHLKSSAKIIHTLIEITAKGGNLLLGVGPNKEGLFDEDRVSRLKEIGVWLEKYGTAIYGTRSIRNFKSDHVYFTVAKQQYTYALPLISEQNPLKNTVSWTGNSPKKDSKMYLIGYEKPLKWTQVGEVTTVTLPEKLLPGLQKEPAVAIRFER
jgi:alpha-L-fucosidase